MPDCGIGEALVGTAAAAATASTAATAATAGLIGSAGLVGGLVSFGTIAQLALGGLSIAGTLKSSAAASAEGEAQQQEANYVAAQQRQEANDAAASGERAMISQEKQTAVNESNAIAASGASGTSGSVNDNTNLDLIADEGKYRALTAMYQGEAKSQGLNSQAAASDYQGNIARNAGDTKSITSLISGTTSLFSKYGSFSTDPLKATVATPN